jgi:hypothetical protein
MKARFDSLIANDRDARLVKAAPQLLDALKEIANGEGYYGAQAREYKEIAKAAIALVETP